jgi:putative transposase
MKKSKFTDEQILFALQQAEVGQPVGDVCRQMGVSEATFYDWKKRCGNLGLLEVRELRQLRDESAIGAAGGGFDAGSSYLARNR